MKISTSAELTAAIMDWGAKHQVSMNALIAKAPAESKADLETLKTGLGDILAQLKLPEAKDVTADVFAALAAPFKRMMDYADGIMLKAQNAIETGNKSTLALQGFEKQITDGDLLAKDKIPALTDAAKQEGVKETMEKFVTGTRKAMIATAGLPEADAGTLALGVAEFDAAFAQAKTNVAALAKKGLTLANKGKSWVTDLAWKPATAFQGRMTEIEDLIGGFKPAAAGGGDPLLGAGGGAGVAGGEKKTVEPARLRLC